MRVRRCLHSFGLGGIDVSNQSLAAQEAEIYQFIIRTTDLKDPV